MHPRNRAEAVPPGIRAAYFLELRKIPQDDDADLKLCPLQSDG